MDSSFWFDAIKFGWFIVYIRGSQVLISKSNCISSLKMYLSLENVVDADDMPQSTHLGVTSIQRVN